MPAMATGTPATRVAQQAKIDYTLHEYVHDGNAEYGVEATHALGVEAERVFKTLVCARTTDDRHVVGIVPVATQLDLKALAAAVDAKHADMARPADSATFTGYVLGGISPLGQKRRLPTVIDASAAAFATMFVSGGQRGLEIELAPDDLVRLTDRDARGDRAVVTRAVVIRPATHADVDVVLALWQAAGAVPGTTDDAAIGAGADRVRRRRVAPRGDRRNSRRIAHRGVGRVARQHVPARGAPGAPARGSRIHPGARGRGAAACDRMPAHHRARRRRPRARGRALGERGLHVADGDAAVPPLMEELASRLAEIPGVEAVTLGGSRATGTARARSDWDFGLYYRDTIDPADIRSARLRGRGLCTERMGAGPQQRTRGS